MSDYGLRVKNSAGTLIIDSIYQNFALWEHGENISTVDQGDYHKATVVFSTASAEPPLIAIKPDTDDYCGLAVYTRSGGNYTGFEVYSEDKVVTFSWQAFVARKDKSSETYGLRIYNATTDLVYDSGHSPMVIEDIDTTSPAYNAVANVSHPSNANAYFIMSPHGFWQTVGEWNGSTSTIRNYLPMMKYINAATLSFGGREYASGQIPAQVNWSEGYWPNPWTIITVDKAF